MSSGYLPLQQDSDDEESSETTELNIQSNSNVGNSNNDVDNDEDNENATPVAENNNASLEPTVSDTNSPADMNLPPPSYENHQNFSALDDDEFAPPPSYDTAIGYVRDSLDAVDSKPQTISFLIVGFNGMLIALSIFLWNSFCRPNNAKIFLRVFGFLGLGCHCLAVYYSRISHSPHPYVGDKILIWIKRVVVFTRVFLIIWFFTGAVWVYSMYERKHPDCNTIIYNTAFWMITLPLSLLVSFFGYIILYFVARCFCVVMDRRESSIVDDLNFDADNASEDGASIIINDSGRIMQL